MSRKTFYAYVLTYRGGDIDEAATYFAEAAFQDAQFPKHAIDYDEISSYIEMLSDEALNTQAFDVLWNSYETKYV
ncbi:MAG: YozE family protein [Caryophanon sp.]|nr:YozE family protein [Caryophanon sp.]